MTSKNYFDLLSNTDDEEFSSLNTKKEKPHQEEIFEDVDITFRTKACAFGLRCSKRVNEEGDPECLFYHKPSERHITIFRNGKLVNAKWTPALQKEKDDRFAFRQKRQQELLSEGKWKTLKCNRVDQHNIEWCAFYHSEGDRNDQGFAIREKKRVDDLLVANLKKGLTVRWG